MGGGGGSGGGGWGSYVLQRNQPLGWKTIHWLSLWDLGSNFDESTQLLTKSTVVHFRSHLNPDSGVVTGRPPWFSIITSVRSSQTLQFLRCQETLIGLKHCLKSKEKTVFRPLPLGQFCNSFNVFISTVKISFDLWHRFFSKTDDADNFLGVGQAWECEQRANWQERNVHHPQC